MIQKKSMLNLISIFKFELNVWQLMICKFFSLNLYFLKFNQAIESIRIFSIDFVQNDEKFIH